jgi:hypothetical protein
MSTLAVILRDARSVDLTRIIGRLAGLVAFGALLYSYCHLLADAAWRGLSS